MVEQNKQSNFAASRLDAHRLEILEANPNPPRSEIVDMMLFEALEREDQIAEAKAEKGGPKGLRAAQRRPVKVERQPQPSAGLASPAMSDEMESFFENLLAPASATEGSAKKDEHDN